MGLRGQVYGAKAALHVMRAQGGGTIIGVSSAFGIRAAPLYVAYCVAKHGNTALYEGLRVEEQLARSGVAVTMILPPTINTPFSETVPSALTPAHRSSHPSTSPKRSLRRSSTHPSHPRRHIHIGVSAAAHALQRLSPRAFDVVVRAAASLFLRHRTQPADDGRSNHDTPLPGTQRTHARARLALPRSRWARTVGYHPTIAAAAAVAATAIGVRRRR